MSLLAVCGSMETVVAVEPSSKVNSNPVCGLSSKDLMLMIFFVIASADSVAYTVFPYMCVTAAPPASGVNVNRMPTISV